MQNAKSQPIQIVARRIELPAAYRNPPAVRALFAAMAAIGSMVTLFGRMT